MNKLRNHREHHALFRNDFQYYQVRWNQRSVSSLFCIRFFNYHSGRFVLIIKNVVPEFRNSACRKKPNKQDQHNEQYDSDNEFPDRSEVFITIVSSFFQFICEKRHDVKYFEVLQQSAAIPFQYFPWNLHRKNGHSYLLQKLSRERLRHNNSSECMCRDLRKR